MMPPRQPVPSPVAPPAPPPPIPASASVSAPQPQPFSEDKSHAWKQRLTAAKDPIKRQIDQGKINTRRYEGKVLDTMPNSDTIVVPLDYSYVEQKKPQLCFKLPELIAEGLRADSEQAAPIASAVINESLGQYGVNAKAMLFECLTDVLCPVGWAVSVIGYTPTVDGTKPVVVGQKPVEVNQPGAVLGLSTTTQTEDIVEQVPNIIAEKYFWDRLEPGFLRVPAEFRGSDFDKSPWIGYRFSEDVKDETHGRKRGSSRSDDEDFLLTPIPTDARSQKRWGTRVYYKASLFDADAKHPDLIRTFVLYDDETEAKDLKNCPYQRWMPNGTMIGMIGYPVHVLTLRYLPDSCFPPSDVQMSRPIGDEINKGRTQMIQRRDRGMPQVGYDATRVLPDSLAKIQKNENTGFIGFNGPISDDMIKAIDKGTFGRENFEFNNIGKGDYDQAWALGANAGVLRDEGNETATKATQIQSAVQTRLEGESTRVMEFYTVGAMKLFALKQLFSTNEDYVRVVGQDGAARFVAWTNQSIPGQYAFKVKPDTHRRIDAAQDREQKLRFYNLTANDPYVNRAETSKMIATAFGLDPARLIKQPDPKGPEPATGSISFKVEDFVGPAAPIAAELAAQCGYKVSPQAMQAAGAFAEMWAQLQAEMAATAQAQKDAAKGRPTSADTEHGGAAQGLNPVDKHASEITGGLPGVGH